MSADKVFSAIQLSEALSKLNSNKKVVVFTNGCFDLLHPGHVTYLEEAKKLGDVLVVGINSDESIKRIKGNSRPINDFNFRSKMLAALASVNYVIEFTEDTPLKLIESISPSVLVKGDDYNISQIVGGEFVRSIGGSVKTISFLEGFSSTSIISKIRGLT